MKTNPFRIVVFISIYMTVTCINGFAARVLKASSEIYSDLRNDEYAMKVIDAYLTIFQSKPDSPIRQPGDDEAFVWLNKQEKQDAGKVARIGLEILKREKDMECKAFIMDVLSCYKNTEKAPLIDEIRNQLQQLPRDEEGKISYKGSLFLYHAAEVLSKYGNESDKQILLNLSRDCTDHAKSERAMVTNAINSLDEKLAKEKADLRPARVWIWITGCALFLVGGILLVWKFFFTRRSGMDGSAHTC